jgi:uncharacterized membrane protein YidH (DUF202 family)
MRLTGCGLSGCLARCRKALGFIAVGMITIVLATIRFVRTGWLLDDTAVHTPSILPDLIFSVILAAMLIALSAYLVVW